jgi:hypothetical protein
MKPFQIMRLFFISLPLLLSACGGGGGSSIEKPDDAISSRSNSSVSGSQSNSVTIHGAVTTDLLIGGDVLITVGSQSFSTTVLSDRKYQANFVVANENVDTPVVIKVRGKNANNWVELASLLPSAQKIKTLAGDNRILESAEFIGVNISPMTTAEYAQINVREFPYSNDEQLTRALFNLSPLQQLDQAGLLHVLLTNLDYSLPKKVDTTLQLLLDVNEATAYLALINGINMFLVKSAIGEIKADDQQMRLSSVVINGEYFIESRGNAYFVKLNSDGTGRIRGNAAPYNSVPMTKYANKYIDADASWIRKGNAIKITPDQPIYYGESPRAYFDDDAFMSCGFCDLNLRSMTFVLISNSSVRVYADAALEFSFDTIAGNVSEAIFDTTASMKLLDNKFNLEIESLVEKRLFAGAYTYSFNSQGTVAITNNITQVTQNANWSRNDNHISIDDGKIDMWLTGSNDVGFNVTQFSLDDVLPSTSSRILSSLLVKQDLISFSASDWVGKWFNRNANPATNGFYEIYENNQWRDGYDVQVGSSWIALDGRVQIAESATRRIRRELLSMHDEKYYFSLCQGLISAPSPTGCSLEIVSKLNELSTPRFWSNSSNAVFYEESNEKLWRYSPTRLYRDSGIDNQIRISENKMYSPNIGTIQEVISLSPNSIRICEYPVWSQCSNGKEYNLIRGLDIKLTKVGTGTVTLVETFDSGTVSIAVDRAFMVGKNRAIQLTVSSGVVSGCNGQQNVLVYNIPSLSSNCELTVTF